MKIDLDSELSIKNKNSSQDILKVKKALNRLGYYYPLESTGIVDIPDRALFNAIKRFQRANDLAPTASLFPSDDTVLLINQRLSENADFQYLWRTVDDEKVREAHKVLNKTVRSIKQSPDPGEDYNCRCWIRKSCWYKR